MRKFIGGCLLVCVLPAVVVAGDNRSVAAALNSITKTELKGYAGLLSSDAFEGREAGARGGRAAGIYVVSRLEKIKALHPGGEGRSYYQEFGNGYRNILAYLPGRDAALKREYILVCAHYDHVGYGTRRNSYGPIGYIHNGADDNASGTAGLLEVAEAFARLKPPPRRSVLFAFWDAEEKGLLGSEHWVRRPTVPRSRVRLVWNIDMIGRLRKGRVEVHGTRSGKGLRRFISEYNNQPGLRLDFKWVLPRESDHNTFLESGIPAIMLHTGKHADYHRPSDDANKLNIPGMQKLARLTFQLAYNSAEAGELPAFRRAVFADATRDRRQLVAPLPPPPMRLGVSWDGRAAANGVLRVVSVEAGSPASRAGLRVGDRIDRFAGIPVRGGTQFRQLVMSAVNPVRIVVDRNGAAKPLQLTARLVGTPRRVGISWSTDECEPGTVILRRVVRGSPADAAGLKVGDRIYAVAGKPFRDSDDFRDRIAAANHKELTLSVERQGNVHVVRLRLDWDRLRPVVAPRPRREIRVRPGISLKLPSPGNRFHR